MKRNDVKDLHTKDVTELKALIAQLKEELFNLKMDHTVKKLKNTRLIFNKRKDIARVLTILKRKI